MSVNRRIHPVNPEPDQTLDSVASEEIADKNQRLTQFVAVCLISESFETYRNYRDWGIGGSSSDCTLISAFGPLG